MGDYSILILTHRSLECEGYGLPKFYLVTGYQMMKLVEPFTINKCAIAATKILNSISTFDTNQAGMAPGYSRGMNGNVNCGVSAQNGFGMG